MTRLARRIAVLCVLVAAGCSAPPASIVGTPVLEMNPSGKAPLSGLLSFTTDQPARATLTIRDDDFNELVVTPVDEFGTEHELMVLGLRPDRLNTIELSLENENGLTASVLSIDVQTHPLPDWVPPIDVRVSRPALMEPGVTFLPVFSGSSDEIGYIVAVDAQGDVVWYYDRIVDEPRRMQNGNFLMMDEFLERRRLIEVDMLGRTVRQWSATGVVDDPPDGAIPVLTDTFHHDVLEMPSGNIMAVSTEIRHFDAFPTSDKDPDAPKQPQDLVTDRFVEFRPHDGAIVRDWSLYDLLDRDRIVHGFDQAVFYQNAYDDLLGEQDPLVDWSHSNGIFYEEATDSLIVSVRKMSAVIKIDLAANELVWILGNHEGWGPEFQDKLLTPIGDVEWPYGQHAPKLTPAGTLILYDNGSFGRAFPMNDPVTGLDDSYSRAVEYEIDEANMTVREVWSYGSPDTDHFFSTFVSEADMLPQTDNVLITNGGQAVIPEGETILAVYTGTARVFISIMEVTHTTPPEKIWEISIDTPNAGWDAFRVERLPSLYP
jgi:arylsulfate sulfotransferase